MIYSTIEFTTKAEDFDSNGNLRTESIAVWFQLAAEQQVVYYKVAPKDLVKRDLMWALAKMKIQIKGLLQPNKTYKCTTIPVNQKNVTFKRDYIITELDDSIDVENGLILGTSQWCIMNYKTRTLAKSDVKFVKAEPGSDIIPGRFAKFRGKDPVFEKSYTISNGDIDYNDHCNNCVYFGLSEQAKGRGVTDELLINFVNESRLGDEILIYTEEQDDKLYVEGRFADGNIVFQSLYK